MAQEGKGAEEVKAAIYLRVSTEEQRERQSIATQRDFAERFCALHEIPVADYYADDGISGTVPLEQRPEGTRLLDDARAKKVGAVLVYKLDRLGREPRLILNAVKELEDLGAQVKSMTEPFDTSTPAGRFLLTILSGVAGLERENIIQRSVEGTNRLAREGVWLGGLVPFGYRVEGERRDRRLVISEQPLPGTALSEADVIRLIYRLAGDEGKSCIVIAEQLNALGIPPAYVRDALGTTRGKRRKATAGIWRSGRVRNLLISPTYRGLHQYGKRSLKQRDLIDRPVPPIVDTAQWDRAQKTLRHNWLFSRRSAKRQYLLRGLMKCAHCGLTYIGTAYPTRRGDQRIYYVCNGKHQGRAIFGGKAAKCPSKAISGDIEDVVWRDVEGFLRDPGPVLRLLRDRMKDVGRESAKAQADGAALKTALQGKDAERNSVLALYRRGRIDAATLDQQLDEIERERGQLEGLIRQSEAREAQSESAEARIRSVEDLLGQLSQRLTASPTWEVKRQLVEALVDGIRVDTVTVDGKKDASVSVSYCFSTPFASTATCTPASAAGSGIPNAAAAARRLISHNITRG
jgi:site-specific DNA recombinase